MSNVCKMRTSATVKMVLDTRYKKQNADTFPVRLRVTHNRKQKYYGTKFSITQKDWSKKKPRDTFFEITDEEKRAAKIIEKLPTFNFEDFERRWLGSTDTTLKGAFNSYIKELTDSGQAGTASVYQNAINQFEKYKPGVNLKEVTLDYLKGFEKYSRERSKTYISINLRCLRAIMNRAILNGDLESEFYPFKRYQVPASANKKKALTLTEIGQIYDYQGLHELARDYWLFLYFCCGINPKDMCLLKFEDIRDGRIIFERSKTERTKRSGAIGQTPITEEIQLLIDRLGNKTKNGYVFPILKGGESPERIRQLVQQFTHWMNDHMKELCIEIGIRPITTIWARHSFATVMKRSGASVEMISELLRHTDIKTTRNYLDSFEDEAVKTKLTALTSFKKMKAI